MDSGLPERGQVKAVEAMMGDPPLPGLHMPSFAAQQSTCLDALRARHWQGRDKLDKVAWAHFGANQLKR